MRLFNHLALDTAIEDTSPVYSQANLSVLFGSTEKLAVHVVCVCNSGASPTLRIVEESSEDGVYWYDKATLLGTTSLSTEETNLYYLYDAATTLHGGFVRLRFEPGGASVRMQLTAYLCGRTR